MEDFARVSGWALGEVFVDDDQARPLLAWSALVGAVRGQEVAGVLVPEVAGLRPSSLVLEKLRTRCAREVGASLLLVPPMVGTTGAAADGRAR